MKNLILFCLVLCLSQTSVAAPRAVCAIGTSLTNGYVFDPTPYPAKLALLKEVPVVNFGVNGNRLASIIKIWRNYAKPFPYNVLIAEGGTNDLFYDAAQGVVLWSAFQAWIEEAHTHKPNLIIVVITIPPRSDIAWLPTMEVQRQAFNAAAISYADTNDWVLLVNSDILLGNGASPPELQVIYRCEDKLHLCSTGMQVLADYIYSLIE